MSKEELIRELRDTERQIHELNMQYRYGGGKRPSEANPELCARRNALREMLIEQNYNLSDEYNA